MERRGLFGAAIAATLGSDIPFFIRCRPAICRGRGEIMESAGPVPDTNLLLVKPPFPVPTAWAYKAWTACEKSVCAAPKQFLGDIELANDLEVLLVVTVGKVAPASQLQGPAYDREVADRTRLPLSEIVLHGNI